MMLGNYKSEEGKGLNNVDSRPRLGFTQYAEILNGRLAMIGFVCLLTIELINRHGLISW